MLAAQVRQGVEVCVEVMIIMTCFKHLLLSLLSFSVDLLLQSVQTIADSSLPALLVLGTVVEHCPAYDKEKEPSCLCNCFQL